MICLEIAAECSVLKEMCGVDLIEYCGYVFFYGMTRVDWIGCYCRYLVFKRVGKAKGFNPSVTNVP